MTTKRTKSVGGDRTLLEVVQDLQSAEEKLAVRLAQEQDEESESAQNLRYFRGIVHSLKTKIREAA